MKLSDFHYILPKVLIAQYPTTPRDVSRMMVVDRNKNDFKHGFFKDFPDYVDAKDVVVLNDTKVINARLFGRRATGGKVEIFILEHLKSDDYSVLIRPSGKIDEGEEIIFDNPNLKARVVRKKKGGNIVSFASGADVYEEIIKTGNVPLPPYIKRPSEPIDSERYQTVYAKREGATAAPTAGLHFSKDVMARLSQKGVATEYVTLHVNYGTFAPIKTEDVKEHKMHTEEFELTARTASAINMKRRSGGRVIAVGTTSCRVLETCADEIRGKGAAIRYELRPRKEKTDLFIYPDYRFKIIDALLTNFHMPKSTLLLLVAAFAGKDLLFRAYEEAVKKRYRFFSYGDCMLIL
ncbi:MAG: tRNA preQ1(34) S-adenosylmethionine ribosyltransferase-isomerase QueA [Candidatus Omnitrophica bacterium]|nr:tRNA preQ1(34) S-adenosylmethionine ribosyltransferase-isomerase QueA [Candidatus Omnitrophota bacterium]